VVALCDDDTARFIDVGERRLIKAVRRRGLGWCCSLSQGVLVSAADDRLQYIYIYSYIYIYIYTYTYAYTFIHLYICIHTCIHPYDVINSRKKNV
jgi:hypothetical protein